MPGRYSRAEIEAAYCYAEACGYDVLTNQPPWIHREGLLWQEPSQCDLLFVTPQEERSPLLNHHRRRLAHRAADHPPCGAGAAVCAGAAQAGRLEREIPAAWLPVLGLAV